MTTTKRIWWKEMLPILQMEKASAPIGEEGEGEEEIDEEEEVLEEELLETESTEEEYESEDFFQTEQELRARVYQWAERAVEIGKLVKKPRGKKADLYAYREEKKKKVNELLWRVYHSGQMYLVRWSGTRKGTGTFYTRPQLAVPTAHRTLEPLVYDKKEETNELVPKDPETILSLKVVDPAMGSASFLVAALRYLTDALYESLLYHKKIRERSSDESVVTLPFGLESKGSIQDELLSVPPDDERFEQMLKARLKRHIVERCIYGVDIDPLAVELAQLSLWVETMDRELPFEFLKHKLKIGNSLVGCWLDRFEDYPVLAWVREGGDGSKGPLTKKIKKIFREKVKPQMKKWIERMGPQKRLTAWMEEESAIEIQEQNFGLYSKLHELSRDEKERFFRENIQKNESLNLLKKAMDKWCAIWFWPVDDEDIQPLTPDRFYQQSSEDDETIENIGKKIQFFHWELEFPDVFTEESSGFDAVLGNPPWETMKPYSKEFFTRYDPIYRTYGRQEALKHQRELFEKDPHIKTEWISYKAFYKSMSNWVKNVQNPFNTPLARGKVKNKLKREWMNVRNARVGYVSKDIPYRHQGIADLNTYKMFLETAHHLLRKGGRLGMIIPSGLYSDEGSTNLRSLLINFCKWELLFSFENKRKIFDIHSSFKFGPIIVQKGGETEAIQTAFMKHDLSDWESSKINTLLYKKEQVNLFSPRSRTFLELRNHEDLKIMIKVYNDSTLFKDESTNGWNIRYSREFDMTNDSKSFSPIGKFLSHGYRSDNYGRWVDPNSEVALPLYEGRMVSQFDFSEKGWVSGKGRSAVWRDIPFEDKHVAPQFLMPLNLYLTSKKSVLKNKLAYMHIGSATNVRSMFCSVIMNYPTNHSLGIIYEEGAHQDILLPISAIFNSFVFDFQLRLRLGGQNISWFVLKEMSFPNRLNINNFVFHTIFFLSARLTYIFEGFSEKWLIIKQKSPQVSKKPWKSLWALTIHERLRIRCILDAIIAEL